MARDSHPSEWTPFPAIVDDTGRRSDQCLGKDLQYQSERYGTGASGELEQQVVNRERIKPVADFADYLRSPEAAEIVVSPQQAYIS